MVSGDSSERFSYTTNMAITVSTPMLINKTSILQARNFLFSGVVFIATTYVLSGSSDAASYQNRHSYSCVRMVIRS